MNTDRSWQRRDAAGLAFQKAMEAHRAGMINDAIVQCEAALEVCPEHFDALHLLGFLEYRTGRFERALGQLTKALTLDPTHFGVLSGIGLCHLQLGNAGEALKSYDKALTIEPSHAEMLNGRGSALMALKRYDAAVACLQDSVAIKPDFAEAFNNLGNALIALEHFEEAIVAFDRALAIKPLAEALSNRGNALRSLKRFEQAFESYEKAIAFRPIYPEVWNNLGNLFTDLKRFDDAITSYDKALALSPNYADALFNRGNASMGLHRLEDALESYEKSIALHPSNAYAQNNRGNALKELKRASEALESYDKAICLNPTYAAAYNNKGSILNELGQFEEASKVIETAIKLSPRAVDFYYNLTISKRLPLDDPHLNAMKELSRKRELLSAEDQTHLEFALSKVFADNADHDQSFRHLLEGNRLKRQQIYYDETKLFEMFARTRAAFDHNKMSAHSGQGQPSQRPVFIMGMPRSGTSLIEQILATHPMVHGAGEINDLMVVINEIDQTNSSNPEHLSNFSAEELRSLGEAFLKRLRAINPDAKRVIDKTPGNFHLVGLIKLALPDARIIHTRRDPVDTCLSCFSNLFTLNNLAYTYDLAELGRFYREYEGMMEHWRNVLPEGSILEIQYEEVIADLEGQTRRILDYCGLDWEPRCLEFFKTDRPVRTASKVQVRQPLYKSSVGRWHVYERFLGPLLSSLKL